MVILRARRCLKVIDISSFSQNNADDFGPCRNKIIEDVFLVYGIFSLTQVVHGAHLPEKNNHRVAGDDLYLI
jgi:hypothetical protein